MSISLKSLYDMVNSGGVSSISACSVFGKPSNTAICANPTYGRSGENFCTYDGKFGFTLSKGTYLVIASVQQRNDNSDGGGDSHCCIECKKNNVLLFKTATSHTAHWGSDTTMLYYIVPNNGNEKISVIPYFTGRLGAVWNGYVTWIKLSKTL